MDTFDHWKAHAKRWAHFASPLRPGAEDVRLLESVLRSHPTDVTRPSRALLLGVTPEIAHMHWGERTHLVAADRSAEMIYSVWLNTPPQGSSVTRSNWEQLPFPDGCFDTVVGDGCFTLLNYRQYRRVAEEVRRVLVAGGLFIMRFFLRPEVSEMPEQVFADLLAGRIGNFHVFKWRLAQSLHGAIGEGVPVAKVWEGWDAAGIGVGALAARTGWSEDVIATINAYRNAPACYTFPTLAEVRAVLGEVFIELDCLFGDYELGERCPTLVLRKA